MTSPHAYSPEQIDAVYRAISERRDVRHFRSDPVDEAVLQRLLQAAHAAPSVGLMQPWRFIRIRNRELRQQLHTEIERERQRTAEALGQRSDEFMQLKVQGVLDCAEVCVVTLMNERERHVFGRRTMPEMDLASASCAVQNLWLAARAEGIGVGWVSIYEPAALSQLLQLPEGARAIAILCIGHVDAFYEKPMLELEGWAERGMLDDYVMVDSWQPEKAERAQQQWRDAQQRQRGDVLSAGEASDE